MKKVSVLFSLLLIFSSVYGQFGKNKPWSLSMYPYVFYRPETSVIFGAAGIYAFNQVSKDSIKSNLSTFTANGFYTLEKQWEVGIGGQFLIDDNQWWIQSELSYQNFILPYFGIGPETVSEFEENYDFNRTYALIDVSRRILKREQRNLYLGGLYEVEYTSIKKRKEGGLLETEQPIGYKGSVSSGIGLYLTYDDRDDINFTYEGFFIRGGAKVFPQFLGSDFLFYNLNLDTRAFFNVKKKVVFGLQFTSEMSFGDIPFNLMPSWGGEDMGRGYDLARYRDNYSTGIQGEIRLPLKFLKDRVVLTAIVGAGKVDNDLKDLYKFWDFKPAIGFGGSLKLSKDNNVYVRANALFWKDTWGVYVVLNEAF